MSHSPDLYNILSEHFNTQKHGDQKILSSTTDFNIDMNIKLFLSTKWLLKDHVTLKTGVMAAENSKHISKLYLNAYFKVQ